MRRKKFPLILVLLVVISLPFILKGLMYLRVQQAVDDIVASAEGQFEITYAGIETELKGAASIVDVRIRPQGMQQAAEIGRVRLSTGDPWTFVQPDTWFGSRETEIPDKLNLVAESVRIPLDSAFEQALRQQVPLQQAGDKGCDAVSVDPLLLKDMGFEALVLDFVADYWFDADTEELSLAFDFDLRDIETLSLALRLDGWTPASTDPAQLAGVRFALADLRVRVEPEFGHRLVEHCARKEGITPEQFEQRLIAQVGDNLQGTGITLGGGVQQALQDYYRDWGDIRLYIKPEEPLGMLQIAALPPDRLVQILGVNLFINEKPVTELDIRFGSAAGQNGQTSANGRPDRVRIIREFESAPPGALGQYIGRVVRVYPEGQPARQGVLVSIVDGEALVRQRTSGGSITSHVPLRSIRTLEVEKSRREPVQ